MIAAIDWGALGEAAWTSVAIGLGVMLVATVAVTSSLRSQDSSGGTSTAFGALTIVCVVLLVAAVVLGINFMVDK